MATLSHLTDDLASWLERCKTQPGDMTEALDRLVAVAHLYKYDEFATTPPPRSAPPPYLADQFNAAKLPTVTWSIKRQDVENSLRTCIGGLLARGWDSSNEVWFCRKVESAITEHDFEAVLHPKLVGFALPRFVVDTYVSVFRLHQAALRAPAAPSAPAEHADTSPADEQAQERPSF